MILPAETRDEQIKMLKYIGHFVKERPEDLVGDMPFRAFGIVRDDKLLAAIVYYNYRRASIEFHLGGAPGWAASMLREDIQMLFAYPFVELGCRRVWCLINRRNKAARRGAEVLGFKVAGVAHDEFGTREDGIIYAMRRHECRWIKHLAKDQAHGRKSPIDTAAHAPR